MAGFLECVAAAARTDLDEPGRLLRAEAKARSLGRTARSQLPKAVDFALRQPVFTARHLSQGLGVTLQAALGLVGQLVEDGVVTQATRRAAWRAYGLAWTSRASSSCASKVMLSADNSAAAGFMSPQRPAWRPSSRAEKLSADNLLLNRSTIQRTRGAEGEGVGHAAPPARVRRAAFYSFARHA
jgi:HTH DNA binding domain